MKGNVGQRRSMVVVSWIQFLTFIDTTIISVGLASIQSSLNAGLTQLQWVVGGYALVFAAFMLSFGKLADNYGRRRILALGMSLFTFGSLISALSVSPSMLIAGRCIMGLGAAASEPGTLSMIRQIYPESSARTKAFGIWAAVAGLAIAVGPAVGGLIVGLGGFRDLFWFSAILGIFGSVGSRLWLPESFDIRVAKFDYLGSGASIISLAATVSAVIIGESSGYGSPYVVFLFICGLLFLLAFIKIERSVSDPMVDLNYFRIPTYVVALINGFTTFFAIIAVFFFTALYLQLIEGYSGYRTAFIFLPMTIGMVLSALFAGRLVAANGPRRPLYFGAAISGIGILLCDLALSNGVDVILLMISLTLVGFGFGITVVPVTSIAVDALPADKSAVAAATTNAARGLGVIAGVSVLGSLLNRELTVGLTRRLIGIGVPSQVRKIILATIQTGSLPGGSGGEIANIEKAYGPLLLKAINIAYLQFHRGLSIALVIAGVMMLVSALASSVAFRSELTHPEI